MIFGDDIIIENHLVRLEPLREHHVDELWPVVQDPEIWLYQTQPVSNRDQWNAYLQKALDMKRAQQRYPFLIIDRQTNLLAGSTSYGNFFIPDRRVEIGWTWLGNQFQGTLVNKACKFLLLSFAFEKMDMLRVELKTDVRNARTRAAIVAIGATEEGIFRSHMSLPDGSRRDTIYYSILAEEWPMVRRKLMEKISPPVSGFPSPLHPQ